jgi:transposase
LDPNFSVSDLWDIDKDDLIEQLIIGLEKLRIRVLELDKENSELRERLLKYEIPKNSGNSSITPSKGENCPKKNQSLRTGSGKKVGGQPGSKGNTLWHQPHHNLRMTGKPDR